MALQDVSVKVVNTQYESTILNREINILAVPELTQLITRLGFTADQIMGQQLLVPSTAEKWKFVAGEAIWANPGDNPCGLVFVVNTGTMAFSEGVIPARRKNDLQEDAGDRGCPCRLGVSTSPALETSSGTGLHMLLSLAGQDNHLSSSVSASKGFRVPSCVKRASR